MYPKPIFWHSGQFLEPQHFQDTDRYHQNERSEILKYCRPFYEGVARLAVNPAALAEGALALDAAEITFIDGSHVVWTGKRAEGNASPPARPLPAEWRDDTLTVYVRLDRFREHFNAAGLDKQDMDERQRHTHRERYDAWVDEIDTPDRYAQAHATLGNTRCTVTRLYYNVQLLWADELGDGDSGIVMPLLRLRKQGDTISLDQDFIPPLSAVKGSGTLTGSLQKFMHLLAAFPRRMENSLRNAPPSLSEQLTRQSAARLLADLDTLLHWEKCHPWEIFRSIRNAYAEMLSAAGTDPEAEETGSLQYDHYNLGDCFPRLLAACVRLLTRFLPKIVAVIEAEYSLGILLFHLPEAAMAQGVTFRLSVQADEPLRGILAEGRLIGGSPEAVRDAVRLALPELPFAIVPPPRGLSSEGGIGYLAPNENHAAWKKVMAGRCMALAYYPRRDPGAERLQGMVRLYALRGGEE